MFNFHTNCRFEVSDGVKPAEGTWAFASMDVVLTGADGGLGFENVSLLLLAPGFALIIKK